MDLIFRGDNGIAINPDYLCIRSFEEGDEKYYHIRACFNGGDNWVRVTNNYDSYGEAINACKAIYEDAISTALNLKNVEKLED